MPDRHDTRAWRMLEALDRAPYRNEARLALIEAFLLEERREAVAACGPCHVPECSLPFFFISMRCSIIFCH